MAKALEYPVVFKALHYYYTIAPSNTPTAEGVQK